MWYRSFVLVLTVCWATSAASQQQDLFPGLSGEPLVDALAGDFRPASVFGYDRARDSLFAAVYYEDGTVRCVYTDWPISIDLTSSTRPRTQAHDQGVNTEHTWPQYHGAGSGPARSDLHHLFPTRADANSSRSNHPFAQLAVEHVSRWWYMDQSPTSAPPPPHSIWSKTSGTLSAFEPRDEHKGRVARAMFYFYTIYREEADSVEPLFMIDQMETLYAWHRAFPPDEVEHQRNHLIASYQDEKVNPFITDTSLVRRAYFSDPSPGAPFDAIYTFDGTVDCNSEIVDVTVQPEHVTFSSFSRTGVLCENSANVFNSRNWPVGSAPDDARYVEFTVEANAGRQIEVEHPNRITFTSRRSSTGPPSAEVRYSIDGGDFVALGSWELGGTGNVTNTFYLPATSGASSVSFRFYGWDAGSMAGTLRLDDVRLTGRSVKAPHTSVEIGGGSGWRMLSVPGTGMLVSDLAAQNLVQGIPDYYPEAVTNLFTGYSDESWVAASSGAEGLLPGRGFLWYLWDDPIDAPGESQGVGLPFNLSFPGIATDTDVSLALDGNGGAEWALLGNPFPFVLDVSELADWAEGGTLESAVAQTWDPHSGSYVLSTVNGDVVEPWTAFIVQNYDATSLTIPVSAEANGTGDRPAGARPDLRGLIAFELEGTTPDGLTRRDRAAAVLFRDGATDGWDLWDAEKLMPLGHPYTLLAIEAEREGAPVLKAQESRPWPENAVELLLSASSQGIDGDLVLTWPRLDIPNTWSLTLTDLETGQVMDLRESGAYSFRPVASPAGETPPRPAAESPPELPSPITDLEQAADTASVYRFSLRVALAGVATEPEGSAGRLSLDGVYPNPSAGPVRIGYTLPYDGHVTLGVYDVLGRRVALLVDGAETGGSGEITWTPGALAGGVYFVRLEAAGAVDVRRVVLLR